MRWWSGAVPPPYRRRRRGSAGRRLRRLPGMVRQHRSPRPITKASIVFGIPWHVSRPGFERVVVQASVPLLSSSWPARRNQITASRTSLDRATQTIKSCISCCALSQNDGAGTIPSAPSCCIGPRGTTPGLAGEASLASCGLRRSSPGSGALHLGLTIATAAAGGEHDALPFADHAVLLAAQFLA
jgi:hypothetical protein